MANIVVKILEEYTSTDAVENVLLLAPADEALLSKPRCTIMLLIAGAGTIQFSVGEEVGATQKAWTVGDKVYFTFLPGVSEIRFKASAAGVKFTPMTI